MKVQKHIGRNAQSVSLVQLGRNKLGRNQLGRNQLDAKLSSDVYNKKRESVDDWEYIPYAYFSNDEHATYINKKLKEVKIAFRGTANLKDVGTDAMLALGKLKKTDRFKRENQLVERLKKIYKGFKITVTGHSLAGSIASEIANNHNLEGSGFNAGFGIRGKLNNENFQHYRTSTDPVSILGKLRGEQFDTVDGIGHGIDNFI